MGFDGKVASKRQHGKQMKDWESRCRSAEEAAASCVHLNKPKGDHNQNGLPPQPIYNSSSPVAQPVIKSCFSEMCCMVQIIRH